MTGKLTVDTTSGRVTGPADITYNDPFPCVNGSWGSGAIRGVVMHTMVGNLPGTVTVFNEPAFQASAHFGIDQQGNIHQFGPIGKGWIAWAEEAGNAAWYSIEHADDGDPANALTDAQITASAQLLEVLSRFAGFPLQVTDSTEGTGYGTHVMGGAAWGGHTCPGPGPRAGQRAQIVALAMSIRQEKPAPALPSAPSAPPWQETMLNSLPILSEGAADKPGGVCFVHRARALVLAYGMVTGLPLASALAISGEYDAAMAAAVQEVQEHAHITADKIVGADTWSVLITGAA